MTRPGAPVPLMTMSARASSSRRDSKGAALPPRAAASSAAFSKVRPPRTVARAAAAHEMLRRQLAHLARAHEQHVLVLQLAEDLARQLDRDVGDGDRVATDARLRAHALGRGQRAIAQRVEGRAQGARLLRRLVGLLDLPEDLRLADHHRLQAGRDAEGVADGLRVRVAVDDRVQLAPVAGVIAGEERLQRLHRVPGRPGACRAPRGCRWRGSWPRPRPSPRAGAGARRAAGPSGRRGPRAREAGPSGG